MAMSDRKTLYIVGAGASNDVGLPTGSELKESVAQLLDIRFDDFSNTQKSGDPHIFDAIRRHIDGLGLQKKDLILYQHAGWRIRDAMPQAISIDNFIDTHKDDEKIELCGKLAIVRSILDAERSSQLYIDPSNVYNRLDFKRLEKTWYASFMKLLSENCTKEGLSMRLKSITLIIFNYDRCVEHYLYNSLQNYYGLEPSEADKLVNEMEIYHPYGIVGRLPWQGGRSVKFGADLNSIELLNSAHQIKTFTEGTDPESSEILAIRDKVIKTDRVVFLGFAYHKLNMKLLMSENQSTGRSRIRCFGTAKGISKSDCGIIAAELGNFYRAIIKDSIQIRHDLDCYRLFDEYWRSLSLT